MAKGFGKFVAFCTVVGAAAAGAYYYMSRRDKALADDFDDDFDDFSDFDDLDGGEEETASRGYVNLNHEGEAKSDAPEEDAQDAVETEDFFDDTDDKKDEA